MPYWNVTDLQARLGAEVVLQCFDDDNDGAPDTAAIALLQADSDSKIEGYLRGIYSLDAVRADPPNQVKRLSLDFAVAYAAQRNPAYIRRDWAPLMAAAEREARDLREGRIRLDVEGSPEPAANQGGIVEDAAGDTPEPVWNGAWGAGDY